MDRSLPRPQTPTEEIVGSGGPHGSGSAKGPAATGEGGYRAAAAGVPPGRQGAGHLSGRGTLGPAGTGRGTRSAAAVPVAGLCLALTSDVHAILTRRGAGQHGSGAGRATVVAGSSA